MFDSKGQCQGAKPDVKKEGRRAIITNRNSSSDDKKKG